MTSPLSYTTVTLPSKGALYEDARMNGGKVEIRKMTAAEEAMMAAQSGSANDKLNRLIAACSKLPPGIETNSLLTTDRLYLLLCIRSHTFGSKYKVPATCKHCGTKTETIVDLSVDLALRNVEEIVEPVEVKLVDAGCVVGIRFLRGYDEEKVAKVAKRAKIGKSMDAADPSFLYRLGLLIVERDGVTFSDAIAKEEFIRNLTAADTRRITLATEANEPGIDLQFAHDCPSCGAVSEVELAFTDEFFRPTNL